MGVRLRLLVLPVLLALLGLTGVHAHAACGFDGRCPAWQRTDTNSLSPNAATTAFGGQLVVVAGMTARPELVAYGTAGGRRVWSRTLERSDPSSSEDGGFNAVAAHGGVVVATGSVS